MAKVEKFEDLIAWQKARSLVKEVYTVTSRGSFAKDYGLKDQIRRAAVSVMSNIAEGFERYNPSEFHQFLMISKSSCAEVSSQLFVAVDIRYVDQDNFERLQGLTKETSKIIGGLRASIKKRKEK